MHTLLRWLLILAASLVAMACGDARPRTIRSDSAHIGLVDILEPQRAARWLDRPADMPGTARNAASGRAAAIAQLQDWLHYTRKAPAWGVLVRRIQSDSNELLRDYHSVLLLHQSEAWLMLCDGLAPYESLSRSYLVFLNDHHGRVFWFADTDYAPSGRACSNAVHEFELTADAARWYLGKLWALPASQGEGWCEYAPYSTIVAGTVRGVPLVRVYHYAQSYCTMEYSPYGYSITLQAWEKAECESKKPVYRYEPARQSRADFEMWQRIDALADFFP